MTLCMCMLEVLLLHTDSLSSEAAGNVAATLAGAIAGCLDDVCTVCAYTRESACSCVNVCPDYAGIIVGRWRKLSLKVRVVWLIRASLHRFN